MTALINLRIELEEAKANVEVFNAILEEFQIILNKFSNMNQLQVVQFLCDKYGMSYETFAFINTVHRQYSLDMIKMYHKPRKRK